MNKVGQVFLLLGGIGLSLVLVLLISLLKLGKQRATLCNLASYTAQHEQDLASQELYCYFKYDAQVSDEISASCGDRIYVINSYDDGWINGVNLNTGKKGILPLICLRPQG